MPEVQAIDRYGCQGGIRDCDRGRQGLSRRAVVDMEARESRDGTAIHIGGGGYPVQRHRSRSGRRRADLNGEGSDLRIAVAIGGGYCNWGGGSLVAGGRLAGQGACGGIEGGPRPVARQR